MKLENKFSIKNYVIVAIVFMLLIIILANTLFKINLEQYKIINREEPLIKNKAITFLPGETYIYKIKIKNISKNVSFKLKLNQDCFGVFIGNSYSHSCIKNDGTDQSNSNSSFSNIQIFFFKPWMLALTDNWTWVSSKYSREFNKTISNCSYKVIGNKEIYKRKAYIVEVSCGKEKKTMIIDKEKRILLNEIGDKYKIALINTSAFHINNINTNESFD